MSFDDDAASTQDSRPRDGIKIEQALLPPWRITTSKREETINGEIYLPYSSKLGDIDVPMSTASDAALEITIPSDHPAVQRYVANLCPPKSVIVTVYRKEKRSNTFQQRWRGFWTSISYDSDNGNLVKILIPSRMNASFAKRLPTMTGGFSCQNVLFDENCKVDKTAYRITATVTLIQGAVITIDDIHSKPDNWAKFGKVIHVPSGEWMEVGDQVGRVVTMRFPIFEINTGDAIELYAGCTHAVDTGCRDQFNNVHNFNGQPVLKISHMYKPGSQGMVDINKPRRHLE